MPEDERQGVPLDKLPDELVVAVLTNLADRRDVLSIERFGSVCRKSRLVSLDPVIWRRIVEWAYVPPQVEDLAMMRDIGKFYDDDWRHMYINHPRIYGEGIMKTHGSRFLILSLTTGICDPYAQAVTKNQGSYGRYLSSMQVAKPVALQGFYIGTWRLEDSTVIIEDLLDSEGIFVRYGFEMTLDLKSKPHGRFVGCVVTRPPEYFTEPDACFRWNKLTFTAYNSVQLETGEREPLVLKHERPFWFSKVKSYTP
ncbi:hypothetical protein FRC00_007126 [Tulasnella sp. 408]|nr:hypothetical protein FRC00_007126 [Tulasnella sp. 408]